MMIILQQKGDALRQARVSERPPDAILAPRTLIATSEHHAACAGVSLAYVE